MLVPTFVSLNKHDVEIHRHVVSKWRNFPDSSMIFTSESVIVYVCLRGLHLQPLSGRAQRLRQ